MNIHELDGKASITITKEDLFLFLEQVIKGHTEKGQDLKFPERMNLSQVARYLNYSKAAVYKMIGNCSIPCIKIPGGGKILFLKSEIEAWLAEGRQSTVSDFCLQQERKRK